jgi:hypothetical protein
MTASKSAQAVTLLTNILEVQIGKMTNLIEGFCDIPQFL